LTVYFCRDIVAKFMGGTLMTRTLQLTAAVLFLGLVGACDQKGPLRVDRVEPDEGISGGGDQVTIIGSGFQPGKTQVEVRFGRRKSESVVIASNTKINVLTPGGDKGPVEVVLDFDNGQRFSIKDGFRYVAPQANEDMRRAFFSKQQQGKK
jgi:hypothetical protein